MSLKLFGLGDCKTGSLGTRLRDCDKIEIGDLIGIELLDNSWEKEIAEDGTISLDEQIYLEDVKKGLIEPILNVKNFTDNTPENGVTTDSLGVEKTTRLGLPKMTVEIWDGIMAHKILHSKNSFARYRIALKFTKGTLYAHNAKKTKLKGFSAGRVDVSSFKLKQGDESSKTMVSFQLTDALEYNQQFVFVPYEKLDTKDVMGVVNLGIQISNASASGFEANITSMFNTDDVVLGLDDSSKFKLTGANSSTSIDGLSFNASTQKYEFVASGLVSPVQVETNDGTNKVIADAVNNLFKGISNEATF